ncbi:MAG: LamG-like jellyroll fold domain-containing protein, partial [Bacteroidales bacterium]
QTAEEAYLLVLENAGAILPRRDTIDRRVIHEVITGSATYGTGTYNSDQGLGSAPSGIIDSQTDVGGWPALYTGPAPEDRDHDGMPDSWETDNGLDPDDPEDRNDIGAEAYTNLEIYLNSITQFPSFLLAPTNVSAELTDFTEVEVTWTDNSEDEVGFRIERAAGDTGSFVTLAEVQANVTSYVDSLLNVLTLYRYRVMTYNDSLESGFDGFAEVTTLSPTSLPLPVSDPTPENNAVYVDVFPMLEWIASINADSYAIYFGIENPPPFVTNQIETNFEPGELEKGLTYYWRIDGSNVNGTTEGVIWSFTVKPEIAPQQVAYWKFDEMEGTKAANEGDPILVGELVNMSPSSWTNGILDGALIFDGTDDYVMVSHNGILDFGRESFSISAWLKAETLTGNSMFLIHKGSFSADEGAGTNGKWYGIEIKNNELRFAIDDNSVKSQATLVNVGPLLSEKWAHIAGVRDTEAGILKLYVNGEMLVSVADGTGSTSQDIDLHLGSSADAGGALLGVLDEVKLFNYALSDAEVQAIYEALAGNVGIEESVSNQSGLVRVYPNPFNGFTTISYLLESEGVVKLCLYNMLGREIKTLVDQQQSAGEHSIIYDAGHLDSGIYLYSLKTGALELRGKMLLSK